MRLTFKRMVFACVVSLGMASAATLGAQTPALETVLCHGDGGEVRMRITPPTLDDVRPEIAVTLPSGQVCRGQAVTWHSCVTCRGAAAFDFELRSTACAVAFHGGLKRSPSGQRQSDPEYFAPVERVWFQIEDDSRQLLCEPVAEEKMRSLFRMLSGVDFPQLGKDDEPMTNNPANVGAVFGPAGIEGLF